MWIGRRPTWPARGPAGTPTAGVYSGSITYQVNGDGSPHSYSFWTIGSDTATPANVESKAFTLPAEATANNLTFPVPGPLAVTGAVINQNYNAPANLAQQRSFIRYVDLELNQSYSTAAYNALNLKDYVYYRGTGLAPNGFLSPSPSNSIYSGRPAAVLNGLYAEIDFGAGGVTAPNLAAGPIVQPGALADRKRLVRGRPL